MAEQIARGTRRDEPGGKGGSQRERGDRIQGDRIYKLFYPSNTRIHTTHLHTSITGKLSKQGVQERERRKEAMEAKLAFSTGENH
jgi:hypothetical protein